MTSLTYDTLTNLLDVYTTYYNKNNNSNGNLFDNADLDNKHNMNTRMIELTTLIKEYKKSTETDITTFQENNSRFKLTFSDKIYYGKLLLSLLLFLSNEKWRDTKWTIEQLYKE